MKYQPWKRTLCCLLTAVLIFGNIPIFSFAEESDGLCPHHTVHTPECGYTPASPGSPCTHEHTEGCYQTVTECVHAHDDTCGYIPAVEGHGCDCVPDAEGVLTHAEGCGYVEAVEGTPCGHTCSAESGCVTRELVCPHIHDAACGYIAPTPEQPCTYVCQDCAEPQADEAVEAVRALMEALPSLEEVKAMSMEDQAKAYNQVQKAYDAYDALTDDQKAQLPEAEEIFAPLFEYFNSLTAPASDVLVSGTCGDNLTWELTDDGVLTISGTGAMSDGNYAPWYDYRSSIKSVVMDSSMIYIGERAFQYCSNLTDVTIPESVTGIGSFAFACCHSLTGITLPSGLTTLGSNPFGYCNLLTSITIPETNASFCSVDGVLFNKACTEILSVPSGKSGSYSIPESVTGIGSNAFTGCKNLTDVTIPEGVTSIANAAFDYCSGLTGITIPESVTSISTAVFEGCSGLTGITIPERVTSIGSYAFSGCSGLTGITIPSSVTSIDRYAFGDCSSLTSITFSGDAPTFSSSVFSNVTATVYYPNGNSTWENVAGKSYGGTLTWETYGPASEVASGTCGENLTWVLTSDGVLTINGTGAMYDYTSFSSTPWYSHRSSITSLVVSEGATSIGSNAFRGSGLESVSFVNASLSLGNYSFAYCESLTSIDFGSGTIQPGEYVFWNCTSLTSVHVPQNVVMNGNYSGIGSGLGMFSSCSNLQTATVDCGYVGPFFFESCYGMTQATFTNPNVKFYYLEKGDSHPFNAGSKAMNVEVVGCLCSQANVLVQKGQRSDITLTFSQIAGDTTQHTEQVLAGTATCTDAGLSEGKVCSVCGYVIEKQTNVDALGHALQSHDAQAATCTENGWEAYDTCSRCNYTTYKEIPAAHTLSPVEEKAATCTDAGNIAHYHCSACQKNFEDETGTKVLTTVAIPAGHNFVDGVCTRCDALGGTCGENLTWVLTVDGTLTISGTGAMADYEYCEDVPWFSSTAKIKHVVIESGATSIGSRAFGNCLNLTDVSIPEGVTSIGTYAFYDCSNLTGVTLPDSMTSIGEYAFKSCSKLSHINIPNGVTTIDENAFVWCESLTEVSIPASVTTIGQGAFSGCAKLEGISVDPDNPNYSSDQYGVLFNKDKSTLIHFPRPFSGEYTIPDSVTTIGCSAFCCCSLAGVTIPEGVTSIGESAFSLCPNLTSITIPEGVTQLPMYAFQECTKLTSVTIPDSVTFISYCTFASCTELRSITIPKNVTQVSMYAFASCSKLQTITFTGDAPSIINYAFNGITATAYYPFGNSTWTSDKLKDYGGAITWKAVCSEHSWGEWAVTTPATPEADGVETRKCAVCQQEETRPLVYSGNRLVLTGTELENQSTVWIDGAPVSVQKDDTSSPYVVLPEGSSSILVTYSFNTGSGDRHTQYPTGMNVYRVETTDSGLTVTHLPELQNLLQYSGCSIRITGNKGIRMITSINKGTRSALMGNGLAGYTLVEYGTALCRAGTSGGSVSLVLGGAGVKSNHAYKQGVADPIFKDTGSLIQYTNVLVGFTDEDCKEDIAMRPYIILADEKGETVTIYGGIVYRSIGYIAWQNRNAFTPGSAAYEYVWNIIRYVYGDQYDADYKG